MRHKNHHSVEKCHLSACQVAKICRPMRSLFTSEFSLDLSQAIFNERREIGYFCRKARGCFWGGFRNVLIFMVSCF